MGVPEEIGTALARGARVVTGNDRAARGLRRAVDRKNRAAGLLTWAPPELLTWDAWAVGLWRRLVLAGGAEQMLLSRTQEMALWRRVIEEDATLATLERLDTLAGLAADAWGGLARYRGLGWLRGSATNTDAEAFERWAGVFEERCRERGYLPRARLEGALRRACREGTGWVEAGSDSRTREVLLVGFDRLLPAQRALLDALREAGWVIGGEAEGELATNRVLAVAKDEAEEMRAAAWWARQRLEAQPGARMAVIVPGLKDAPLRRAAIDRVFRNVLAPEGQAIGASPDALPYEFSSGVAIGATPMGAAAMDLLRWPEESLPLERIGALLLSPLFGGAGEASARAEFDAFDLRVTRRGKGMLRPEMTLDELVERVLGSGQRQERLRALLACLKRMQALIGREFGGERRTFAEWADRMRELLAAAEWAQGGVLDSVEFQTRERWESVLDELATLDFEGARVPYRRAFDALESIAEGTVFAPESREAPVQVMGPDEAAGSRFDAIWFLGAGDLSWPGSMAGNPLLAWPLRRELGMPGTDGARDASEARRVTERLARSGAEAVFSYAREAADGRQRPSAVLAGLGLKEVDAEVGPAMPEKVELEIVDDLSKLPPLPEGRVAGGAGVLQAQAACAFRAFAEHRLFAREMETRSPGMDAREGGQVVHGMLEHFWAEVETQAALKAMSWETRDKALERAVGQALTDAGRWARTQWDRAYLETQRRRLLAVGRQWLDLEAGRAVPFRVVRRESEEEDVAIGPLRLSLRLDRVDETDAGAVLIDYKTGKKGASAWLTDRPDEPQLPLYAVMAGETRLAGIAFGTVRTGETKLRGYEAQPGTLERAEAMESGSLEEQVEAWRGVLVALATKFAEGDTRVSPKRYPVTCTYCAQRLICRLDAGSLDGDMEDGNEEGGNEEGGLEDDLG